MTRRMPVDELHWRLSDALRRQRLEGWPKRFAVAFVGRCKKGIAPTRKMARIAREIVSDMQDGTDGALVEDLVEEARTP